MARILVDEEWYDELAPTSLYESEFEAMFTQQAPSIYPEHVVVNFTTLVQSDTESARPDLALIEKAYREWWVLEVEMSHHSLQTHVLPQVRTLSQGAYGPEHVDAMCSAEPLLDRHALLDMVKGKQPSVLVIVNAPQPDWQRTLAPFGAGVAVFQVFRSNNNKHLFRVNGDRPRRLVDVISRCSPDPLIKSLLRLDSPAGLGVQPHGRVTLRYGDKVTLWERVDSSDTVWLQPISANPLAWGTHYEIVRLSDGALEIRAAKK